MEVMDLFSMFDIDFKEAITSSDNLTLNCWLMLYTLCYTVFTPGLIKLFLFVGVIVPSEIVSIFPFPNPLDNFELNPLVKNPRIKHGCSLVYAYSLALAFLAHAFKHEGRNTDSKL